MLPIEWRPEASADLATVITYIAERNLLAAERLHATIEQATTQLRCSRTWAVLAGPRTRANWWFTPTTSWSTASPW